MSKSLKSTTLIEYFDVWRLGIEVVVNVINEPVHEKTNNMGFRTGPTQTGLYSHRRWLEAGKKVGELYYPYSENEVTNLLRSRSAPLFSHMQIVGFPMRRLIYLVRPPFD